MRRGARHDGDHQRRRETPPLDLDPARVGTGLGRGEDIGDDGAGLVARSPREDDEAPRRQLAVVGHARRDRQHRVERLGDGPGSVSIGTLAERRVFKSAIVSFIEVSGLLVYPRGIVGRQPAGWP